MASPSPLRLGETVEQAVARAVGGADMGVATVYRCVSLLCDSVAALPFELLRRDGEIYRPAVAHELYRLLLVEPDGRTSAFDFFSRVVAHVLLHGNAYIVPVRGADYKVASLVLCSPYSVTHTMRPERYVVDDPDQGFDGVTLDPREVIHIKGMVDDRVSPDGMSVLGYARGVLSVAKAGDNETLRRLATGGNVRAIVSNAPLTSAGLGHYQPDQMRQFADDLDYRFNDAGQGIVAVPYQLDVKQLGMNSADMQFLETRKFSVREICRMFGVPPSFVFDDTSNNYKSAEMANSAFLSNTLNPLLRKIEVEFLRKLFPSSLWPRYSFRFDRSQLTAADMESRVRYMSGALGLGRTINEMRRLDNLPPVPGGDTPLVSANLKSLDEVAATRPPQTNTPTNQPPNTQNQDNDQDTPR